MEEFLAGKCYKEAKEEGCKEERLHGKMGIQVHHNKCWRSIQRQEFISVVAMWGMHIITT